jgi:alkaline phosphatase
MGLNYVAAEVLKHENNPFQKFPTVGLSITKSIDELITDSGAAATSIATGYRTKDHFISVDTNYNKLQTVFELANKHGLLTGIVVTDDIAGATPAAFYAHHNSRYERNEIIKQIADANLNVIIGGGEKYFKENPLKEKLISLNYKFYYDFSSLAESKNSEKILGLLGNEHLPKAKERNYSLGELTTIALNHLSENEKGFLLMIEGSQIDWAGHDENASYLLSEMEDFTTAVNTSLNFAEENGNTLVIVTADHETGGMAITDGSFDGDILKVEFLNSHHTAGFVGVFAFGPGKELFNGIYQNYMIGRKIFYLMDESYKF